jgi:hypothetical protein
VRPDSPPPGIRLFNVHSAGDYVLRIDRPYNENLPEWLLELAKIPFPNPVQAEVILRILRSRYYHAWKTLQILGKPFSPGSEALANVVLERMKKGGARDPIEQQKWWTLEIEGRPSAWRTTIEGAWEQNAVWDDAQRHDPIVRRWAELALWYPALAPPAGAAPVAALSDQAVDGRVQGLIEGLPHRGGNVDFSSIGGSEGPSATGTASHSYLQMKGFAEVWAGFRAIQTLLAQ